MTNKVVVSNRDSLIELLKEQFERHGVDVPFQALYKMAGDLVLEGVTVAKWNNTAECPPTKEDGDENGYVLVCDMSNYMDAWQWDYVARSRSTFPYWMPLPDRPV